MNHSVLNKPLHYNGGKEIKGAQVLPLRENLDTKAGLVA